MLTFKLFLFLTGVALTVAQTNPIVKIANGLLRGRYRTIKETTYASFEGIPYARPPVGKYRFRDPQPMKPWTGVWDATRELPNCLQYEPMYRKILGSEDCLFINVFTPKLNRGSGLPVVVFIHGGAFMFGAGSIYDASGFMEKGMVAVTFNYRLGPLGFLSTGDDVAPGNAGLKDQAFALHWIKNNIQMFGGNPDDVTLTGLSAGGASVHYQYLSPLSKGTFTRGIAFSGSSFAPWTLSVNPLKKAKRLSSIVGCPTTDNREMVECLKYRPGEVLINAQLEMMGWRMMWFTAFTPTVEGPTVRDPFIAQYPYHLAQSGGMHKLPLIVSVTSEEGLYPAAAYQLDPDILPELENRWGELASNIFEYNDTLPLHLRPSVAAKIKKRYLGDKPVSQETFPQLVQALGDRLFAVDCGKLAQIHAKHSGQPVYFYRYSFTGELSLSNAIGENKENYGASHADDVLHIFKIPGFVGEKGDDALMTEVLLEMVHSFATTGVPNVTNHGPKWLPVTPGSSELNYLEISSPTKTEMRSSSDFGQRSFWDSLGFVENENYRISIRDEL